MCCGGAVQTAAVFMQYYAVMQFLCVLTQIQLILMFGFRYYILFTVHMKTKNIM